jgi:hypothetical protein
MKLIYTSQDRFMVWTVKNTLELAGYPCHVRNEYAAGGAGDIAPIETWPEVWLENESQYDEANDYLDENLWQKSVAAKSWRCPECGELNAPAFEICWNCAFTPGEASLND